MSKTAICTGISGAIGGSIAKALAKEGYDIVGIYNKSEQSARAVMQEIESYGAKCELFQCDFSDSVATDKLGYTIYNIYTNIDLLINCAGVASFGLFDNFSADEISRVIDINLKSSLLITRPVVKRMLEKKSGSIINISSMWGEVGASCEVIYSTAKAGLIGFTKALAKEISPSGIRVNCITPGLIRSDMNSTLTGEDLQAVVDETPLGRMGEPEDIAKAVLFLASDKASFITGEVLKVNGGLII